MSEEKQIEVLIIGAGNIGRVYGYHLFKGGAKIHYYVREHHKQNLTNYPLRIHRLSSVIRCCNKVSTENFSDYTITTDTDISNGNAPNLPEHLDYILFTVPAHSLSKGDWLKSLVTFLNNKYQKNVYYASPAPDETGMQRLLDLGIDKSQLISAQTNVSSYFAPLANQRYEPRGKELVEEDAKEKNPNKVIVCCPTLSEKVGELTSDARNGANKLAELLNKGGLKTVNIGKDTQYGISALLATPAFAGFAMYDWNFYNAGKDLKLMSLMNKSLSETAKIIMKKTNNQCSFMVKAIPYIPTVLFASSIIFAHFLSAYVFSFDFEAFSNAHFNVKLGEQTDYWTNVINKDAETYGVDITNFKNLIKKYKEFLKKDE